MNSAVTGSQSRTDVNFLLKDSTDAVNCVFYQIVSNVASTTNDIHKQRNCCRYIVQDQ